MAQRVVAAIFDNQSKAERGVKELRHAGISDDKISVVQRNSEETSDSDALKHDSKGAGVAKGAAAGGAVGAVAGLVALAIPGLGPFIAAGAIGQALGAAGSAALASGIVGAAAGGLAGALVDYGISEDDAKLIEQRLNEGAVLVTVDTKSSTRDFDTATAVLRAAGGQTADESSKTEA